MSLVLYQAELRALAAMSVQFLWDINIAKSGCLHTAMIGRYVVRNPFEIDIQLS